MNEDSPDLGKKPYILACIPAFNEEKYIAKVVLLTRKYVDGVLVCDNGSLDMTAEIAGASGAQVVVEGTQGKGAALKSLFVTSLKMGADVVITLDGDGQHDPADIPKIVEPLVNGEADIVNGSRLKSGSIPRYRWFGNAVLNWLTMLGRGGTSRVKDSQSGFRGYTQEALRKLDLRTNGIGIDSQIMMEAISKGLRVIEVPVTVNYGKDTSTYNPLRHALRVITDILVYTSQKRPLLLIGLPGCVSLLAGVLSAYYAMDLYVATGKLALGLLATTLITSAIGIVAIPLATILYSMEKLRERIELRLRKPD